MPFPPTEPIFTNDEFKAAVKQAYIDGYTDARHFPNHDVGTIEVVSPDDIPKGYTVRVSIAGQTLYR